MTYIQTYTGKCFNYLSYQEDDFCIEDIAHSLSRTCRFNGHCETFVSVAEHSYWTSYLVPPEFAKEALLHDASEAYIGDIPSPLKKLLIHVIGPLEDRLLKTIFSKYGLAYPLPKEVKDVDREMLYWEYQVYVKESSEVRWEELEGLSFAEERKPDFQSWSPEEAKVKFLERFHELFPDQDRQIPLTLLYSFDR